MWSACMHRESKQLNSLKLGGGGCNIVLPINLGLVHFMLLVHPQLCLDFAGHILPQFSYVVSCLRFSYMVSVGFVYQKSQN